jgi:2-iminobutanoate/2-iminopropanoate deaminase
MAKTTVVPKGAPAPLGPYSPGVWAGELFFVSGQTPIDPVTGAVADAVADQTKQAIRNVQTILEAAGLTLDNVVKSTVFIKNMNDFAAINAVYGECFATPYPARSCVEVARLPKDVLVEIEVVASRS